MHRLHVATFNLRNLADRWFERLALILADMSALQPDLLGLQECVNVMQQDRVIGAAGQSSYAAFRGWSGRPEYGNSLLVRDPLAATDVVRLELELNRAALPVRSCGRAVSFPEPIPCTRRSATRWTGRNWWRRCGKSTATDCGWR